jgi:NAD-dependent DNA ligase
MGIAMSPIPLDDSGQPVARAINATRLDDRAVDELIGVCKGLLADGKVVQAEAVFLQKWMEANTASITHPMVNGIYWRLKEMLVDQVLDPEEQRELFWLLQRFTGQIPPEEELANMSTMLPVDDPQPAIEFKGRVFCFTGKFLCGARQDCQQAVLERGGRTCNTPAGHTDYLVVGTLGSTDWVHSPYGRKIEKAVDLRAGGSRIAIISEDHWVKHI